MTRQARYSLALVGVLTLAVAAFARVVRFGFVYDDDWTIVHNRFLLQPIGALSSTVLSGTASSLGVPDATRPAMIASSVIDRRLFDLAPAGWHAHSLVLYLVACTLAALALLALSGRRAVALAGAAFFALAPLHAEVVASVNYREDLLAAVGLSIPLASLVARRRGAPSLAESALCAASFLCALLAKESAVALVPMVAVVVVLARPARAWATSHARTLALLFAVLVVWGDWRWALALAGDGVPRARDAGALATLLATARYEVAAAMHSLVPLAWSPEHAHRPPASPLWLAALAVLVAVVWLLSRRRSTRPAAVGIALAMAAALPTSPLAHPVNEWADRYLFVSILGGALVWGHVALLAARAVQRRLYWAGAAVGLAILGVTATRAAAAWSDDETLFRTATERAPTAPRGWVGLSHALRLAGRLDEADVAAGRALALDGRYAPAHLTRAYGALARGDLELARSELERTRRTGGATLPGYGRASRCVEGAPEEAPSCILDPR